MGSKDEYREDDIAMQAFEAEESGVRLDVFLAEESGESRAQMQKSILEGRVFVNGTPQKANYRLQAGDEVVWHVPPTEQLALTPEDIPVCIVYQDADICVVNKAQGMVVHPAPGNRNGTLVNALLYALNDLSGVGGVARPGIVHRIDKMTSGLLVVAKNDMAHASLSAQIKAHTARRRYLALVEGNIKEDTGTIHAPIGRHKTDRKRMAVVDNGREATTHFRVLLRFMQYTLVEAELETGRTHQIRVHMKHIHHPVAGDPVYSSNSQKLGLVGQALHAYSMTLMHPRSGEEMCFFAPPPESFLQALKKAGWDGTPVWKEKV
ncbi:RluA family pseudouridine synthase [Christensenellaceae bacterium OttesenSCG-928-L17]|nr:RluA family pseudouridine synthase [Christensenellaceae bacterium OttesenSCG-928-L17]